MSKDVLRYNQEDQTIQAPKEALFEYLKDHKPDSVLFAAVKDRTIMELVYLVEDRARKQGRGISYKLIERKRKAVQSLKDHYNREPQYVELYNRGFVLEAGDFIHTYSQYHGIDK